MNGVSALIKQTPEGCLALSTTWGHSEKGAICEPGSRSLLDAYLPVPCLQHREQ